MTPHSNLKTQQWFSLLIWVACFVLPGAAIFAVSGKYYGPVWSLSMSIIFLPHFYWAYKTIKLSESTGEPSKWTLLFKFLFVLGMISLCVMLFRLPLPLQLESEHLETALTLGFVLFFSSIVFFSIAARSLVGVERDLFNTSPNAFLAFVIFFYLPIGIFFLVPRLQKIYDASPNGFD
ncbi:hypothetical protein N9W89_01465 [Hellea sp.]|nr:hypothetical protein [Hellea sp.]